ncbi:MAG: hypothetical protein HY815_09225 [Candidatus Riflebacteria bacterium]|nr:hypothetical protein [Candidatus Riflebacteria bacterium]
MNRIVVVSSCGTLRAPVAAGALRAQLALLGIHDVEVIPASLTMDNPRVDRVALEALASLGIEGDQPVPVKLTAELVREANLILCMTDRELEEVRQLGQTRAHTLAGYLDREAEWQLYTFELDVGGTAEKLAGNLAGVIHQVAVQIGYEVEAASRPEGGPPAGPTMP